MTNVPKNAFRVYTGPNGRKNLVYIDPRGSVLPLKQKDAQSRAARLPDGYYTTDFELIYRTSPPKG